MNPAANTARSHLENEEEAQERKTVTFDRKEFLDFLQWVGVRGEYAEISDGSRCFTIEGNMGNTFTLDEVTP